MDKARKAKVTRNETRGVDKVVPAHGISKKALATMQMASLRARRKQRENVVA